MSRDDSGTFLAYAELEITRTNPFAAIDQAGTGQLMKIAVRRATRPGLASSSASAANTAAIRRP